jgi:hypothetical protein
LPRIVESMPGRSEPLAANRHIICEFAARHGGGLDICQIAPQNSVRYFVLDDLSSRHNALKSQGTPATPLSSGPERGAVTQENCSSVNNPGGGVVDEGKALPPKHDAVPAYDGEGQL